MTYRKARSAMIAEYKAAGKTNAEIQEALDAADSYFIDKLGIAMDTLLKVPER